jgi:Sulfotransferase family
VTEPESRPSVQRLAGADADAPEALPDGWLAVTDPVFVLCSARSGSTLLRFLLDGHPGLACPPETNVPQLCVHLATVWSLAAGAPLAAERGTEPPVIPDAAVSGVRHTLDLMLGSYLARRGKQRYCDKSLGAARFATLLKRMYPEAKFLCLYRHPMDVVASGLEACPWGLTGYGFDSYIAASPGNMVLALARYWADGATAISAAEEAFADSCHRVRYEDLVADPEGVAEGIFRFLGVAPAPGISSRCFTAERERTGPADYKIWHTSEITTASVGRGWQIPVRQLSSAVLEQVNVLASGLGYLPVGPDWGSGAPPDDVRADTADRVAEAIPGPGLPGAAMNGIEASAAELGERLRAVLAGLDDGFASRWREQTSRPFGVAVTGGPRTRGQALWRVDLAARSATAVATADDDDTDWEIAGSAAIWQQVLDGEVNIGVALRRQELRYCDADDVGPAGTAVRIDMFGDFLGLACWPAAASLEPEEWPAKERVRA